MIADEGCEEVCGHGLACIGREQVNAVGRLVEAFANVVDLFFATFDLHPYGSLENVADDGAGVGVGLRVFAGTVANFNDVNGEMIAIELRQWLRQDLSGRRSLSRFRAAS